MRPSRRTRVKIPVWSSLRLAQEKPLHFFTTRAGGVSPPPFDSLNVGLTTKDKRDNVLENRRRVEEEFQVSLRELALQAHGNQVLFLTLETEIPKKQALPQADVILTNIPGFSMAIFFADCVPIYLWDPKQKAGGLAHAGWRGTLSDVAGKAVEAFGQGFRSDPGNLVVALGPSIGPCCFEVGPDVAERFSEKFGTDVILRENARPYVNLWEANRRSLLKMGVKPGNLHIAEECTSCLSSRYYSYRRDCRETGRMAGVMKLPP